MRTIDADTLIDGYKHMGYDPSEHPEESYMEGWCKGFNSAVDHCIHHVIHAPTIEPERKTGKWVKHSGNWFTPGGDMVWECSECGKGVHVYGIEYGTYGADVSDGQWKACPNCTTLMEE